MWLFDVIVVFLFELFFKINFDIIGFLFKLGGGGGGG